MRKVEVEKWRRYAEARNSGLGVGPAAKKARISSASAYRFEAGDGSSTGLEAMSVLGINQVGGKIVAPPLNPEVKAALEDFSTFRLRYFGRSSTPWQERAAYKVLAAHESPDREYVVMNEPPGTGKSTLFTHDIPVWLVARERSIRMMIGSRTGTQARQYLTRLKRTFEREYPLRASADALAAGTAADALATVAADFGAFKPANNRGEVWSASRFTVAQLDGMATDDKEPTAAAYGQDEGFLGGRYDLVIWDDLVDRKNSLRATAIDNLTEWWMTEAETRLEPGGLLLLQGQRMAADDLYRFCLDMKTLDEEVKYSHVVYPAHDDSKCEEVHGPEAKPWPDGCLLDPARLPYKHLAAIKRTSPKVYDVQYQQNDGDSTAALVQSAWLTGGEDGDGFIAPGCYDSDRPAGALEPEHITNAWSLVTVDPSPTNYWALGWWVVRPEINSYVLAQGYRQRMSSPDFLTMDLDSGKFGGLLEEIRVHSVNTKAPITHVVVEYNAAQRYLVTQPHVVKWQSAHGITIIPHQTNSNKNDPKFGVTGLADFFRQGRIRIPTGDANARDFAKVYANELTHWPNGRTDDTVMMTWFMTVACRTNYTPRGTEPPSFDRPEWAGGYSTRGAPGQNRRPSLADRLVAR